MTKENFILIIMIFLLSACQGPKQKSPQEELREGTSSERVLQKVPAIEQSPKIESTEEIEKISTRKNDDSQAPSSEGGLLGNDESLDNHQKIEGIPELIIPDNTQKTPEATQETTAEEISSSAENAQELEEETVESQEDQSTTRSSHDTSSDKAFDESNADETPNVSGVDYSNYQNVQEVINDLIKEYDLPEKNLGIIYENRITNEHFYLNENKAAYAASTNKVGLATLYIDQIDEGSIKWQTHLPASAKSFQAGDGLISNSPLKSSYSLEDLMFNLIVYSDNTAWRIMLDYYNDHYGDVKTALLSASEIDSISQPLTDNYNYATPMLLNAFLKKIADSDRYEKLKDFMLQAQPHLRFKLYHDEGMATKYGQYDNVYHDTGIYYENGRPVYTLVLMTVDVGMVDTFMGELNLRVNEWYHYQEGRLVMSNEKLDE